MTLPEKTLRFFEWEIQELALEYPDYIPIWLFMRLNEAEPAPSKDWRPYCFNKRCCKKENLGILSDMGPCKSCPYRDLE